MSSYHITWFPPFKNEYVDWFPHGGWSLYRIDGDQIAQRIKFDDDGKVVGRHAWCGFIGIARSLDQLQTMIHDDMVKNGDVPKP